MKNLRRVFKNQKGFTLVELLTVIVILGIIAAIAIPSIGSIIDNSKKDTHIANAEMLVSAARLAVAANEYDLPLVNDDKVTVKMSDLVEDGYLESNIIDPDAAENKSYKTAYVTITKTTEGYMYSVTLQGVDRGISNTLTSELNRDKVKTSNAAEA